MAELIVFDQIPDGAATTETTPSQGNGVLSLTGYGFASTLVELGAAGTGVLSLAQSNGGYAPNVPTFGVGDGELPLLSVYSYGAGVEPSATGDAALPFSAYGHEGSTFGAGTLPVIGFGLSATEDDTAEPPVLVGGEEFEIVLTSDMAVADIGETTVVWMLRSPVQVVDGLNVFARLTALLSSNVVLADTFRVLLDALVDDGFALSDEPTADLRLIGVLADTLQVVDETLGHLNALLLVSSALAIADRAVIGLDGQIDVTVLLESGVEADVKALVLLASEVQLLDEASADLLMFAAIEDSFEVSDDPSVLVALIAQLMDTFSVGVRFRTEAGDEFAGYAVNVRNAAVTEYTEYPYNSLAVIDGRLYGAGPRGIYRLEGDTDDGQAITSRLRLGLEDFGTTQLKRVPNAYVGYTSTGQLLLKVITTDKGQKKENHYRLKPRTRDEPGGNRFDIAKGLVGMYWAFEFENIDGADFELDVVKVWPMALSRRYSGR